MELISLQIDLGRQKERIEYIKSYVDFAKANGYNSVFYYLENAVRTDDTQFLDPEQTYSLDEIREIVEYTEGQGLIAIPAFENLGHMEKFLSYPSLAHLAECPNGKNSRFSTSGNGDCGCMSKPEMYAFMDKYISDVASLFPGKYIHMGLDEVFSFAECPDCRAQIAAGKTKSDMFCEHIIHTNELAHSLGKEMMMWDDFFECMDIVDRLPRDIIFTNWNYIFVQDEPSGHWTNSVKRDWFAYYEELGFRYMFCALGHRSSSIYNVDTLTAYASKYKPMGAIMTSWERANDFYFSSYPIKAYAGRLWSGMAGEEDRVKIYTELLGGEETAKLILSLNTPYFAPSYPNVASMTESDLFAVRLLRDQYKYVLDKLDEAFSEAEGLSRDIIADIHVFVYFNYADLKLMELGSRIFDKYQIGSKDFSDIYAELNKLSEGYKVCEARSRDLWAKYRSGIKSCTDKFNIRYASAQQRLDNVRKTLEKKEEVAILYADLMLHDGFCTVRAEIKIKYEGEEKEELVYTGGTKSAAVAFQLGACYNVRYKIRNKPVEYMLFSVYGEGGLFPLNFRYVRDGKKYVAATAECVSGNVRDEENLLYNDTRFAIMGNNNSAEHFNDISLSRVRHTVKVTFKPLREYRY